MKTPKLNEIRAQEIVELGESAFEAVGDDGRMFATIRIIKAGLSKNNRNYRASALQKAAQEGIFDGVRMFVDHSKGPPLQRPLTSMVSAIESTSYNEQEKALDGRVEFFDAAFYDRAKRAQKYLGVSIDSVLSGTRTPSRTGGRALEDIHAFTQPRSVDWVLFPAAGGQILAFESEGDEDMIDWAAIEAEAGTLSEEDLKKNLPTIWARAKATASFSGKEDETEEEPEEKAPKGKKGAKAVFVAREEVDELVKDALTRYQEEQDSIKSKQESAAELVRQAFSTAGLPTPTSTRVMRGFEGVQEYDEKKVKQAIEDAKEELKAVGAGPRLDGFGPSGSPSNGQENTVKFSAHESVSAFFGKKPAAKSDDPKEGDK